MSHPDEQLWFNTEVKPCEPALRAYLSRRFPVLRDHEDVMQEAYARVLSAKRKGKLICVKAFLFTVARNLALDLFRRHHASLHEPITDAHCTQVLDTNLDAGSMLEQQERLEVLIEGVASLPERCREVIMLRHLDGLSYKEIGAQLGISPNTVKVHLVKGVRLCTEHFRRHGLLGTNLDQAEELEPVVEVSERSA